MFTPEDYKRLNWFQEQASLSLLKDFKFIKASDRVLDVGCGDGKFTSYISKFVPNGMVLGIDIVDSMIRAATREYGAGNMGFMQMDARKLIFKAQFDVITSLWCIHWIPEKEQLDVMKGIRNALTSNGRALLVIHISPPPHPIVSHPKWGTFSKPIITESTQFKLGADSYSKLLTEAKLHFTVREEKISVTFHSRDHLKQWFKQLFRAPLEALIDSDKEDFLEAYVDSNEDGRNCRVSSQTLIIHASKEAKNID